MSYVNDFVETFNFSLASDPKLACSCGCGMLPRKKAMLRLQYARELTHFPWIITSAARCPEYNAKVSSTGLTGPHTTGLAFDIGVQGEQAYAVLSALLKASFTGIGINQKGTGRFIHGDLIVIGRPMIWSY